MLNKEIQSKGLINGKSAKVNLSKTLSFPRNPLNLMFAKIVSKYSQANYLPDNLLEAPSLIPRLGIHQVEIEGF